MRTDLPARDDLPAQLRELIDGGAAAVTAAEITAASPAPARAGLPGGVVRRGVVRRGVVPLRRPGRRVRRPGRVAALAAGLVAIGCAGAVTAAQLSGDAAARRPGGTLAGAHPRAHHAEVVLTARAIREIAGASRAALASAGHALVSYSSTFGSTVNSGTDNLTFSGNNYNNVSLQAGSKIGPWVDRVVNGQIYEYGELAPGQAPHWYHSVSETQHARQAVPDPRDLLRALEPGARFAFEGWREIGGVRVRELRATQLTGLPGRLLSLQNADPFEHLSGLTVWADASGVIRQVRTAFEGIGGGSIEHTMVLARFLDIGKPETITAPASYINQVTHG